MHEHAMAKKTAVRALFNELPTSIEKVSDALQVDEQTNNFNAFAMDPTAGMPMADGEVIEGETVDQDAEEKPEPKPKEKPKPKAETKPDDAPEEDQRSVLVEKIKEDLAACSDLGSVESTLDIWADLIATLENTDFAVAISEAADAKREELA